MTETITCRFCSLGITTADGVRCLDPTCGMRITIAASITHPEYFAISSTSNPAAVEGLVEYAVCQAAERRWAAATAALTDEQRSSGELPSRSKLKTPGKTTTTRG